MRVDAAAPERYTVAKLFLQFFRCHTRRRTLDWIDNVEPGVDKIRKQRPNRPAGMNKAFPLSVLVDPAVDLTVERLEEVPVGFQRDEGPVLLAKVSS